MEDLFSVWRSPLDKVALSAAKALCAKQPQCSVTYGEDFSALTIYSYGHYITTAAGNNPNTALTSMLSAMSSPASLPYGTTGIGGTAFIPQGGFPVTSASPPAFSVPDQCNIVASGGGGGSDGMGASSFYHFVISPPTGATAPTYFLYCSGSHTSGGQYFRDLAFNWEATSHPDICIYANTWSCRAINCTFTDSPVAFNAQSLQCGLEACTVQYSSGYAGPNGGGPGPATNAFAAVVLAGAQCYAIGPAVFLQQPQGSPGSAPTDTCCISFESGLEHAVVRDLHISDWSYGITYAISSLETISHCMITNVEISVYTTCIYMVPSSSAGTIYDQKYTDCVFYLTRNSTNDQSLVYIFGAGGTIDEIEFIGCTAYQGRLHGYEIHGVTHVKIIGGTSSGNGPTGGAGIAITGGGGPYVFQGVNLDASYPEADNVQSQQYAFLCSGSPTAPVLVDTCSMQGYSASPVSVTGTPTQLIITNCPGYNDLNTPISTTAPTSSTYAADASSLGGTSINYYGPSLVIFTNGSNPINFTTNGVLSSIPANAVVVYYVASPYDHIKFSAAPAQFSWLGK